jgi:C2 domain
MLHLKVVRGVIFHSEGFYPNDTYVRLEFSKQKLKTMVAKDSGDNPSWDHTFEVEVN